LLLKVKEMNDILDSKRILVVGGSSGIGLAVAKHAQQSGAHVIIASRNASARAGELPDWPGNGIETHSFDITSAEDNSRLFETIGIIDHLVITVRPEIKASPFQTTDIDAAQRAFDVKFWSTYRLIQVAQRYIKQSGSITLTSGIAGEKIYKGTSIMAVINSATETLCRVLAVELAPLRVNVVSPGFVEPKSKEVQEYACQFPLRKLASLDDVASAYLWLIASPYMTGTVTVIDGGARLI
jgi:NAD(P)-dependent dehydrogenase (short-subunit alcohol dehydrogenase family)